MTRRFFNTIAAWFGGFVAWTIMEIAKAIPVKEYTAAELESMRMKLELDRQREADKYKVALPTDLGTEVAKLRRHAAESGMSSGFVSIIINGDDNGETCYATVNITRCTNINVESKIDVVDALTKCHDEITRQVAEIAKYRQLTTNQLQG